MYFQDAIKCLKNLLSMFYVKIKSILWVEWILSVLGKIAMNMSQLGTG